MKNIGTLVTSAIRPNDSNDPIASAFADEIKGGLHTVFSTSNRDNIIFERREWGMLCYVTNENKTYQLTYNYLDDNILNNGNWKEFSGTDATFINTDTITFSVSENNEVSAEILDNSIGTSKINSLGGATVGYILSNDGIGNFDWISKSDLGSPLLITDYNTGNTFSNISNIVFKGAFVEQGISNQVIVWIPSPEYSSYFQPSLFESWENRYIMKPEYNSWTSSINAGYYGIGDWDVISDFENNVTRNVINTNSYITLFSDIEFAIYDLNTTITLTIYDDVNNELVSLSHIINSNGSTSSSGLTISIYNFSQDSDRYKASVTGGVDLSSILVNGGRFIYNVTHNNSPDGIYSFTASEPLFYESPYQDGINSTSKINGSVIFDEETPNLVYYSGVAYYGISSSFSFTVSGIDNINQITIPLGKQIGIVCNNMPISDTHDGYADGSKLFGNVITGWTYSWNISGLTYSVIGIVDESSYYPGFISNNTINITMSYISSNIYDYGFVDFVNSDTKPMLFDSYTFSNIIYNNNTIDSENYRYLVSSIGTGTTETFNSTASLPSDELQYIFGRIVYPNNNFTLYYPSINFDNNNIDYSNLSGVNKTLTVYNYYGLTTSYTFEDYRWYMTAYGKSSNYNISFNNGVFTLDSNFSEEYLHYDGTTFNNGTGDLVILVGLDSSGNNNNPDKFIFLSGDPNEYMGRYNSLTYNLNNITESSKNIMFTTGTLIFLIRKVWLLIGYKNSNIGKILRINNISLY